MKIMKGKLDIRSIIHAQLINKTNVIVFKDVQSLLQSTQNCWFTALQLICKFIYYEMLLLAKKSGTNDTFAHKKLKMVVIKILSSVYFVLFDKIKFQTYLSHMDSFASRIMAIQVTSELANLLSANLRTDNRSRKPFLTASCWFQKSTGWWKFRIF